MSRVVIVGAGISGLATALAIRERAARERRDVDVVVLEKEDRAGGPLRSQRVDGYLCEWGPNGFLDNAPETLDLVGRLGMTDRLQPSNNAARRRFLFHGGALHPIPTTITGFLGSPLLSWTGKLRLMGEPFIARRRPAVEDESIRDFAVRRLGARAADVLIDAMVSGIFAGDPAQLSLEACFPRMAAMEAEHGGLVRAMLAGRKAKRRGEGIETLRPVQGPGDAAAAAAAAAEAAAGDAASGDAATTGAATGAAPSSPAAGARSADAGGLFSGTLTSFPEGIEELPIRIAHALGGALRTGTAAISLAPRDARPAGPRWSVATSAGDILRADAIVLAGTADVSSRLLAPVDPELAALLAAIRYAPIAVVCLGFAAAEISSPLDGFGFLVPRGAGPRILGALWDSSIFPARAPEGRVLIRTMIGGARDPQAASSSGADLTETVRWDLFKTMGLRAKPELIHVFRHTQGIPQYTIGHLDRVRRLEEGAGKHPGIFLAGSSYRGVAVNACIAAAPALAERVIRFVGAQ